MLWKGAPWRELSNTPKNVGFRRMDQKLWSFEVFGLGFDDFWWRFFNNINLSDKWKFPWRKLLKIGRSCGTWVFVYAFIHVMCLCVYVSMVCQQCMLYDNMYSHNKGKTYKWAKFSSIINKNIQNLKKCIVAWRIDYFYENTRHS